MINIHGNTIKNAVCKRISQTFPGITIYRETVNEGIKYPYFMVYVEDFSETKLRGPYYLQTFIISVLYQYKELPETSYCEMNEAGYKLSEALDLIELDNGDLLRGYSKHFYPERQKLEYYINYDVKVAKETPTKPKQLSQHVNIEYKK